MAQRIDVQIEQGDAFGPWSVTWTDAVTGSPVTPIAQNYVVAISMEENPMLGFTITSDSFPEMVQIEPADSSGRPIPGLIRVELPRQVTRLLDRDTAYALSATRRDDPGQRTTLAHGIVRVSSPVGAFLAVGEATDLADLPIWPNDELDRGVHLTDTEVGDVPTVLPVTADMVAAPSAHLEVDATHGPVRIVLPIPALGVFVIVRKVDASVNPVILDAGLAGIGGQPSLHLTVPQQLAEPFGTGVTWQLPS